MFYLYCKVVLSIKLGSRYKNLKIKEMENNTSVDSLQLHMEIKNKSMFL